MRQRGFSLIEVLIVVAIILVIAAISIPALLSSRIAANEASAVYSIRAINTAQVTYATTYPEIGYASDLSHLGAPDSGSPSATNAAILDWVLGCTSNVCPKSGYEFQITDANGSPVNQYNVWGVPVAVHITGNRTFCSNNMNPVQYDPDGGAAGNSNCINVLQ